MTYSVKYILKDIQSHLRNKIPWSLVRLGDGDLKFLTALILAKDNPKILLKNEKIKHASIPPDYALNFLDIYKNAYNSANYISNPDVYFSGEFWGRDGSKGSVKKLKNWKRILNSIEILNEKYCNPEINFLLFLNQKHNLLEVMRDKKICLITCFDHIEKKMKNLEFDVISLIIPERYSNNFKPYLEMKNKILEVLPKIDIFLIGAGAWAREWSWFVKEKGGICLDAGQLLNAWAIDNYVPRRNQGYLINNNDLTFSLTKEAEKYSVYL